MELTFLVSYIYTPDLFNDCLGVRHNGADSLLRSASADRKPAEAR